MSVMLRSLARLPLVAAGTVMLLMAGFTSLAIAQTPPAATSAATGTPRAPGAPISAGGAPAATVVVPPTFGPTGQPPAARPTQATTPPQPAPGAAPSGSVEITLQDDGKTFTVPAGQTVVVRLGTDLNWTVAADPAGLLPRAPGVNTLVRGVQGIFRAAAPGRVTINGEGRPMCNPGQVCAQFIEAFTATVVITGAAATPAVPTQQAPRPSQPQQPLPPVQPARPTLPPAPGAAAGRPATIAALPNTGVGSSDERGHVWGTVGVGILLLCGTLLGASLHSVAKGGRASRG